MWSNPIYQPTQTIGQINTQKQAACYFVRTPEELAGLNVMPGVFYLGINRDNKEVYIRRMNNDGNIELEQYVLSAGRKEKTDIKAILERLESIEKRLEVKHESVTVNANE